MSSPLSNATQAIEESLRRFPGVRLAILFGSVSRGLAGPGSDVDLAVDLGRVLTAEDKITLTEELANRTGRPVDIIDLRTAGEPLLGQILKYGRRVLGTNRCYAELLSRHLIDAADFLPLRERILKERRERWIGKL